MSMKDQPTQQRLTAQAITDLIAAAVPGISPDRPSDKFHAGKPESEVRGIVVTFMATRDVLSRALELGANFVITHEPTFFQDGNIEQLVGDVVYESKAAFLQKNDLTVWRCHDLMHRARPDMILAGVVRQLGWTEYLQQPNRELFDLPPTTLQQLAMELRQKLSIPHVRVTGNGLLPIRRVAISCGCSSWQNQRRLLQEDGVDALICGEVREWETCEYVRDSAATGRGQGLVVLGHCNSEEAGMAYFADWLRPKVGGIPVHFVPAGDPFWFA